MKEATFKKIPLGTLDRLNRYADNGFHSESEAERMIWEARITTACSVMFDCGVLAMHERIEVSAYYYNILCYGRTVNI